MKSERIRRTVAGTVALVFVTLQMLATMPAVAGTDPSSDLKDIEYRYYFRGDYEKAIEALRTYLERDDIHRGHIVEAREYLAASLILSGRTAEGKAQYVELLKMDAAYPGPDPSVFKTAIIDTYDEARAEYVSAVIRTVPEASGVATAVPDESGVVSADAKPFYKKWWFYATMGVVALAIAGAAGSGDDDAAPQESGTVTIDVDVP